MISPPQQEGIFVGEFMRRKFVGVLLLKNGPNPPSEQTQEKESGRPKILNGQCNVSGPGHGILQKFEPPTLTWTWVRGYFFIGEFVRRELVGYLPNGKPSLNHGVEEPLRHPAKDFFTAQHIVLPDGVFWFLPECKPHCVLPRT